MKVTKILPFDTETYNKYMLFSLKSLTSTCHSTMHSQRLAGHHVECNCCYLDRTAILK